MASEQLFVIEQGYGPAVLLIHGMAGTAQAHFAPLLSELTGAGFRVIAPDLRGHGGSRRLAPPCHRGLFDSHAHDLERLIDQLGLEVCHLVGYSDGGETALALAAHLGVRAASLFVWGVSGQVPPAEIVALYAEPERHIPGWPAMRSDLEQLHGPGGPALLRCWAQAMNELAAMGGMLHGESLARISCPTLIVSGDRDPFNPIAAVRRLATRIAGARLLEFSGAGHDLLAERRPQLTAVLKRFLQGV